MNRKIMTVTLEFEVLRGHTSAKLKNDTYQAVVQAVVAAVEAKLGEDGASKLGDRLTWGYRQTDLGEPCSGLVPGAAKMAPVR